MAGRKRVHTEQAYIPFAMTNLFKLCVCVCVRVFVFVSIATAD